MTIFLSINKMPFSVMPLAVSLHHTLQPVAKS